MKQSIIRNPEFFHILAHLNYGDLERKKSRNFLYYDLDVLQNYFFAFESLVNVTAYETEGSDNNNGMRSDFSMYKDILLQLDEDQRGYLFLSREFKNLIDMEAKIEDMSVYRREMTLPDNADSDLRNKSRSQHYELCDQYENYIKKGSGSSKLIKKTSRLIHTIRSNIAHGGKTPMGPDNSANERNKLVIDIAIPLIRDVVWGLLLDFPEKRLSLYGTLKKGGVNRDIFKEIIGGEVVSREGHVIGKISKEQDLPYFEQDIKGDKIPVEVVNIDDPKRVYKALDRFEGPNYQLELIPVFFESGYEISLIYSKKPKPIAAQYPSSE